MARHFLYGLGLVLAALACGKGPRLPVVVRATDCPDWVFRGGGAMDDGATRAFYGVGAVRGIRNHSLAITTADNRARAEIARTLKTYSAALMKDYAASTTAGGAASAEEQHVEQAIKTFSSAVLTGAVIVDHWHAQDGTIYALARLDFEHVKMSLVKTEAFDAAMRDYAQKKAEAQFRQTASPPTPTEPLAPPPDHQTCQVQLRVLQIGRSAETCYVDVQVANSVGVLTYPCGGGEANARFGKVTFTGTVTEENVSLDLKTEYVYAPYDSCKWWSAQTMKGTLGSGKLAYDYKEDRIAGQKDCNMEIFPCTADGDVMLRVPAGN